MPTLLQKNIFLLSILVLANLFEFIIKFIKFLCIKLYILNNYAMMSIWWNQTIEKIIFKVVQMKFLAMHITNQKLRFDIFTVGNWQNIFMEHDLNILIIFVIKEKCIILTHTMYCWLLIQYTCVTYDCFCAPGSLS